jgi:hypothetical protein
MTLEKIDLLQNYILNKVQEFKGCSDYTRYDLFLNKHTLRLRPLGVEMLKKLDYTSYTFEAPNPSGGDLLKLFRKMEYPYYIGKRRVILYSEQDAFMYKLGGYKAWTEY